MHQLNLRRHRNLLSNQLNLTPTHSNRHHHSQLRCYFDNQSPKQLVRRLQQFQHPDHYQRYQHLSCLAKHNSGNNHCWYSHSLLHSLQYFSFAVQFYSHHYGKFSVYDICSHTQFAFVDFVDSRVIYGYKQLHYFAIGCSMFIQRIHLHGEFACCI